MNKLKKIISVLTMITMVSVVSAGCSGKNTNSESVSGSAETSETSSSTNTDNTGSVLNTVSNTSSDYFDDEDLLENYNDVTAEILMKGDNIEINGQGVVYSNNIISVTNGGTFIFSGNLNDGQIYINNEELTHIIFNGVDISNSSSSPLFIENADKTVITCVDGTENILSDTKNYVYESDEENEPDAVIFSKDDLSLNGSGLLIINAEYNEGITCKDDLRISGSNINISSVGNGIKGKDSVVIKDSDITVNSQQDGIKSSNADETDKGYIVFESGNYNITAKEDAVSSENILTINDGSFVLKSGSESISQSNDTMDADFGRFGGMEGNQNKTENSEKGIKAVSDIIINGGTFNVESTDDCVHSNGNITINGGKLTLNSGDDGIHGDGNVNIKDGEVNIESCYEGIEGIIINIDGGEISITASDDGFNASDGSGSNIMVPGEFGNSSSSCELNINNGNIYVNAGGDGLDSNGIININGGTTVVDGPVSDGDGALDSGSEIIINGGILIAAGSSGMAETPSDSSGQNTIAIAFSQSNRALTAVCVKDSDGNIIVSYQPSKEYSSIIISSPKLISGSEYTIYCGGSITGADNDYSIDGEYEGGELLETVVLSGAVTYAGDGSIGQMGGMGGMKPDDGFIPDGNDGKTGGHMPNGNNGMAPPDNNGTGGNMDPFGENMGTEQ